MDKFCVIGRSLPHTLSPEIHGRFGLNYGVEELNESQLKDFVRSEKYKGFNVTVPYKRAVMQYLDEISPEAEKIGAVNTVVRRNGKIYGYNTDIGGMAYAIERAGIKLEGKNVLILGTGGTSRVAEYLARRSGAASVTKAGRTSEVNYGNVYGLKDVEVIVNTTPVGMFPDVDGCPIDVEKFANLNGVFDVVYNPLKTELVARAEKTGVPASCGLAMLVEQARLARDVFLGEESDIAVTESILDYLYKKNLNLVLTGMPSSGKTELGKILSKRLNKRLIDLDDVITQKTGMTIERIFAEYGENKFRELEATVAAESAKQLGVVIATGGGTVMNEKSFNALRRNGFLVYVDRPIELLVCDGRPVSKSRGVENIFEERKPVYEKADFKVLNDRDLNLVVEEIVKKYEKDISY